MSQVIVTNDPLRPRREKSREQEHQIDKEGMYQKWRKPDIPHPSLVLKALGLVFLPIVVIWAVLVACMSYALVIVVYILKFLGRIFHKTA